MHLGAQAAGVEHRAAHRRGQRAGHLAATGEGGQAQGLQADAAAEAEGGVTRRLGLADPGGGGGQPALGGGDVGALAQGFGRDAHADAGRQHRKQTGAGAVGHRQHVVQAARRAAGEHGEAVLGGGAGGVEGGDLGPGGFPVAARLLHVEGAGEAGLAAPLGDLQGLGLAREVGPGDG